MRTLQWTVLVEILMALLQLPLGFSYKRVKGRSHSGSARTLEKTMQPACHHCSQMHTASLHNAPYPCIIMTSALALQSQASSNDVHDNYANDAVRV